MKFEREQYAYLKLIMVKLLLMLATFRNCCPNSPFTGAVGSSCPGSITESRSGDVTTASLWYKEPGRTAMVSELPLNCQIKYIPRANIQKFVQANVRKRIIASGRKDQSCQPHCHASNSKIMSYNDIAVNRNKLDQDNGTYYFKMTLTIALCSVKGYRLIDKGKGSNCKRTNTRNTYLTVHVMAVCVGCLSECCHLF